MIEFKLKANFGTGLKLKFRFLDKRVLRQRNCKCILIRMKEKGKRKKANINILKVCIAMITGETKKVKTNIFTIRMTAIQER